MRDRHGKYLRRVAALLAFSALTASPSQIRAQRAPALPAGPLTLGQALELAEPRSEAVSIAREGIQRAEGEQIRARSGLRPQLSGTISYDRALASEFEGVFDTATLAQTCPPFALNPQAPLDARVAEIERAIDCGAVGGGFFGGESTDGTNGDGNLEDLPFGAKNSFRTLLSFSQNLYSGGRNGAQAAVAAAGRETAELAVTTSRAQLYFDVTQAYYDAALADRLVDIAAATLEQAGATLRLTQIGFEAGTQPEFEVLRARVSRDSQEPLLIRQRVNREIALLRLRQLLEIPATQDLRLADSLGEEQLPPPAVFAERVAAVENNLRSADSFALRADAPMPARTVVNEAEATIRLREASLRLTEAQKMPSVTLNTAYGRNAYPAGFFPKFDRINWTVGASVSIPILTGGRQDGDERVARAELEQARLQRQQVEELATLDTQSAWAELLAARATWEASAGTVAQASRAYQIANVRYSAGVSTQLELSDSRLQLQQAEANRALAARDFQVARARVALLPNLPLGGAVGAGGAVPRSAQPTPAAPARPQPAPQTGSQFTNVAAAQGTQSPAGFR
jgi:outer membrane protein